MQHGGYSQFIFNFLIIPWPLSLSPFSPLPPLSVSLPPPSLWWRHFLLSRLLCWVFLKDLYTTSCTWSNHIPQLRHVYTTRIRFCSPLPAAPSTAVPWGCSGSLGFGQWGDTLRVSSFMLHTETGVLHSRAHAFGTEIDIFKSVTQLGRF